MPWSNPLFRRRSSAGDGEPNEGPGFAAADPPVALPAHRDQVDEHDRDADERDAGQARFVAGDREQGDREAERPEHERDHRRRVMHVVALGGLVPDSLLQPLLDPLEELVNERCGS